MKLFEFEAKGILNRYGVTIPRGRVARSPEEAASIGTEIGGPVAVKAQVLASGRGKAGGIQFARDAAEARDQAVHLLGSRIKGSIADAVLVEQKLDVVRQLYVSVAIDPQAKSYAVLASRHGGVDIEEVAATDPDSMVRSWFEPTMGFSNRGADRIVGRLGLSKPTSVSLPAVISSLCKIALEEDAELVEVNPLVVTSSGALVAADARVIIDDNALFRHPEFQSRSAERVDDTPLEAEARKQNLAYVDLSGDIGIIGNGAGLVMATLDLVDLFGGRPANFLDIGGGARPDIVRKSLLMVMSKPEVKAVLINILGGITRCDLVAQGVIDGLNEAPWKKPVAIRMIGTNEAEGTRMLQEAGVHVYSNMEDAVKRVLADK